MSVSCRIVIVLFALATAACVIVAAPREIDARTFSPGGSPGGSPGASADLAVNQELVVHLDANPSTGYRWIVDNGAPQILTMSAEPNYAPASTSAPFVGSGGVTTVRFRAVAPGTGTLVFAYRRPWENTGAPARTFRVDVSVAAAK